MNAARRSTPRWRMGRRWIKGMALLVVTLQISMLPARAQTASEGKIIVRSGLARDGSLVFLFESQREPVTKAVTFEIVGASAIASQLPRARLTGDLYSASPEGFLSYNRVLISPVTVASAADAMYTFDVTVTLPTRLHSRWGARTTGAAFDGSLEILAGDAKASFPVYVKIRPGRLAPFSLLMLALLFGALMRWWAERGRILRIQMNRYHHLSRRAHGRIPGDQVLEGHLVDARHYLRIRDAAAASASLDAAKQCLDKPSVAAASPTGGVVASTGQRFEEVAGSHPDPNAPTRGHRLGSAIGRLSQLRRSQADFPVWQRLGLTMVPGIIFAISSLAIAIYGFKTQYEDNPIFGAAGVSDWINLVGWGFAAGYAGKSINDYFAGKAGGSMPGAS
jgi:hypothetical protein